MYIFFIFFALFYFTYLLCTSTIQLIEVNVPKTLILFFSSKKKNFVRKDYRDIYMGWAQKGNLNGLGFFIRRTPIEIETI